MTKELVFKFNHELPHFNEAIGVSNELSDYCREIVYFSTFSSNLIGKELYANPNDIPKILSTMTGDLQKCLELAKTEEEKNYLLLIFIKTHDMALESIAKYEEIIESKGFEKREMKIMFEQIELIMDKKREKGDSFISPIKVINRINLVKKSRYNFEKYLEIVNQEQSNIFGND